jgi:AAA+ ATPase superfamily predicted ATPase
MEFIDRENELKLLEGIRKRSEKSATMTVITGRRRIGKTTLTLKAFEGHLFIYLFVVRKNEILLCQEFIEEISRGLKIEILGEFNSFARLFEYLLLHSGSQPFTLVIDEFQEFLNVNSSVFGEMQKLWDRYKPTAKMNLILCGSVHSMMKKIFEDEKEPLFGRASERINLQPFSVDVLKDLLKTRFTDIKNKDILAFYTITGGAARYVELFCDKEIYTFPKMINEVFRENSLLIDEGKNVLIEEFGRDYAIYFSILSLISSSKTSRPEIESVLQKDIGGYLDKLENEYMVIRSVRPILAKPGGKIQRYAINDNFLSFWFRFVYKYRSAVEIGNYKYLQAVVKRDFDTYSGLFLEKYFREKIALSDDYAAIGNYWEKGNRNEIDIVAIDDLKKKVLIAEVKIKKASFRPKVLRESASNLANKFGDYQIEYQSFSLEDI